MSNEKSNFEKLLTLNVNDKVEKKKDGKSELTYLSWVYAWSEFKKVYPEASYEVKKFKNEITGIELPYMYDVDTGYMVCTNITADNLTYEMWLPVMNSNNKAMKSLPYDYTTQYGTKTVAAATMFDVNKAIMRCLVKNMAMFGLGLYIYAGEDLPEDMENNQQPKPIKKEPARKPEKVISLPTGIITPEDEEKLKKIKGAAVWAKLKTECKGHITYEAFNKVMEGENE